MAFDFHIRKSEILEDVKIIIPSVHSEKRGEIWTSFSKDVFGKLLPENLQFNHDKFSSSYKNVLRGIHGDHKSWKLVSCVSGDVMQVAVDMRENSRSLLKWEAYNLGDTDHSMILLPPGFGNAFYVKSAVATYHYKLAYIGDYIDADEQFSIAWDDPRLSINWPVDDPILSERDGGNNGNN